MTNILNRPAKLLVVPEPLSFSCPVLDFETLAEAARYVAERLQSAHVVWALTPDGRNLTRERLVRIHRASQKRSGVPYAEPLPAPVAQTPERRSAVA